VPSLTIVFGYRDRDLHRVERSLASLGEQSFRDFEAIFVDYGSQSPAARAAAERVGRFDFARYLYSDTRGQPWNRSRALNIGARHGSGEYLLTTDVDMIFPPDFLEVVSRERAPGRVLYCFPHYLPEGFEDWHRLDEWRPRLEPGGRHNKGGCQCLAMEVFRRLRGFDEKFRYWGAEDHDLHDRLLAEGLEERWLNDETTIYHQWHPPVNWRTPGLMPPGSWGRFEGYRLASRGRPVRNPEGWGELRETAERAVLPFLDFDHHEVRERPELHRFDVPPTSNKATGQLVSAFWDLPAGHALAVEQAFFPHRGSAVGLGVRAINRLLRTFGHPGRVDFAANVVHDSLDLFIEEQAAEIADYYLDFPARDGVSLLVRA